MNEYGLVVTAFGASGNDRRFFLISFASDWYYCHRFTVRRQVLFVPIISVIFCGISIYEIYWMQHLLFPLSSWISSRCLFSLGHWRVRFIFFPNRRFKLLCSYSPIVVSRGGYRTAATSNAGALCDNSWRLPAVNYYHKELHLGCCSSPWSTSGFTAYNHSNWRECPVLIFKT